MNRRDPQLFDVYRADLASGTLELAEENPGFAGFVADPGLRLVVALAPRREGGALVMVRDDASDGWRPLCQVDHEDFASFGLPGVTRVAVPSEQGLDRLAGALVGAALPRVGVPTHPEPVA